MPRFRLAFMGTPAFAVPSLEALVGAGHDVCCVYSQPPRPSGRGHKTQPSPVHAFAEARGIPVRTPATLRSAEEQAGFAALNLDAAVVAAYGLILPGPILSAPRLGCFNVHASLLPRWRGAAPIQRAILAGDHETGVTIMQMEAGLDTGPMLLREAVPITSRTTAAELQDQLARLGARLMLQALEGLLSGRVTATKQPEEGVTYAAKLTREDGRLDWSKPAAQADRQVRALTPWPGAWFEAKGERIKALELQPLPNPSGAAPGTLLDDFLTIACAEGAIRLTKVQRPGKPPTAGPDFLRGFPLPIGEVITA